MSESTKPPDQSSEPGKKDEDALIFTPISIARARHASTHGPSVVGKTEQKPGVKEEPPVNQPKVTSNAIPSPVMAGNSLLNSPNSCLVLILLGIAFVVGGVLGGMMGGGLMLWANDSGSLAFAEDTPTPTITPTATPLPVQTSTPTPTPQPVATLSAEDIIAGVIPSVVTVINQQHSNFSTGTLFDEGRVVGSGVIVDSRGYIATNNHVVDTPQEISVVLSDGRQVPAELIAANPADDLAMLKVDLSGLPSIEWGDSNHTRPGQTVYAIGSPLGDFPSSVSFGIVSGLNRALEIDKFVIDGLIQTDAAVNRGSSGGPLIDTHGKVIGINTFIIRESEERGIAEGIAFAIPAATAKSLLIPWIAAHTGESVPIPASEGTDN